MVRGATVDCTDTHGRLVAHQDGELSPSETLQVSEHMSGCARCADRYERLLAATPRPNLSIPPAILRRLHDRVDVDAILAAAANGAANRPHPSWVARGAAWLRRDTEIPMAAVIGYLLLLAAALGWGAASWHAPPGAPPAETLVAEQPSPEIPAEQWQPVSWQPEEETPGMH